MLRRRALSAADTPQRGACYGVLAALIVLVAATVACASEGEAPPRVATPTSAAQGTASPVGTATVAPTANELRGFPLPPDTPADLVSGLVGDRVIVPRGGLSVREVAENLQLVAEPTLANASGWNCAVDVEYEGAPAVDWYVRAGTPVLATMDGTATLLINTTVNAFDYYGADREPYLGDPDRARASVSPFPGPSGGMGLYVSVAGERYRTDYGHLSVARTIAQVPPAAFVGGFSASFDYAGRYATPRTSGEADVIASWPVRRGDVIGYTGDTGYSEAPHLHYQVTRLADGVRLCPGDDDGW